MTERPTSEQLAEMRADVADGRWGFVERDHPQIEDATGRLWYGTSDDAAGLRYGAWVDLSASRMAHLVRRAGYAETLLAEVDALRHDVAAASLVRSMGEECKACAMADREREHLMHDTAKAVAGAEAREEAAIARAETVELALAELRRRAWLHLEYAGGYTDHVSRDGLRAALRDEPTDLAEALRRELRAEGAIEAVKVIARYSHECIGRYREQIQETLDELIYEVEQRAAELRGPK